MSMDFFSGDFLAARLLVEVVGFAAALNWGGVDGIFVCRLFRLFFCNITCHH